MRLFERKHVVFAISMLAVAALAHAGVQARVQGKVTDNKGNPIPDAVITILGNPAHEVMDFEKIVKINKKGEFNALILDATRYYLFRIEAPGYQPQERPFKVGAGSTDNEFDFQLMSIAEATAATEIELREQPGYKEFEEAKILFADGDAEGARAKFEEAVAAKPDLLPALAGLAELNYDAGDMEGALAAARRCLDLDDESVHCLAIAANASQELGNQEAHVTYMAQYKELNPEDPTILFNQAAVLLNKMDDGGARPILERCLAADPDFPQCNFEYAMLLLRSGDMEGAKTHLEKYLEVAPDGPDASIAHETINYL